MKLLTWLLTAQDVRDSEAALIIVLLLVLVNICLDLWADLKKDMES